MMINTICSDTNPLGKGQDKFWKKNIWVQYYK